MAQAKILLQPGTLWTSVKQRTEHALKCGALLSIPTESEFIEQDGVNFQVRILSNLERKYTAKKQQDKVKDFNPFLPYEQDLWVADISETHVCLLNKFNVVDHHILIITRAFEEQETLLTLADFTAMWACLAEIDGLVFYNGGKQAGASQPHKHLQLVPLPMTPTGEQIPIAPLFASAQFQDQVGTIPQLPFAHAFTRLDTPTAQATLERYHTLLNAIAIHPENGKQSGAYNLLATREWMLVIPRTQEDYQGIAVNSLGFAGALLVRNQQQMLLLKELSPMTILSRVGVEKLL